MKLRTVLITIACTSAFLGLIQNNLFAQTTLILQPDSACGKDAILLSLPTVANTNYGTNPQFLATAWTVGGVFTIGRNLVEFDLSSIPAGAIITNAQLSLYAWANGAGSGPHSGSNIGWLRRVTSPWVENTVTWNTAPTFTTVNEVTLPQSTGPNQNYLNIPVTALVQDMVNNPATSFGFIASMQTEQIYRRLNFCSSDHVNPLNHPRLVITYTSANPPVAPVLDLGPDTTICPGQNILLSANVPNATYTWQDNSTNQTFNANQPGTYWVTANNCNGVYTDSIVITGGAPNIDLGNDTTLCTGQTLTLDATQTNATYAWQDNSTNPTFTVNQAGTYWVDVSVNGCPASDSITVNFEPPLIVDLGPDMTLCVGQNVLLDATVNNAIYLWQDNSFDSTFLVTAPGTYFVTVTNSCESVTDSIVVSYVQSNVSLGPDTVLCPGQTLLLDVTQLNAAYIWQDNSVNSTLTVNQTGAYWVDVSVSGCVSSDTILVSYNTPISVNLGQDTIICSGQNHVLDAGGTNVNYLWQDNTTNSTFTVSGSGTYYVDVSNGCETVSDTINIALEQLPSVDLGADVTLCAGQSVTLSALQPNVTYLWQDNSTGPDFIANGPGTYAVDVTNICGTTSDMVNVTLATSPNINLGIDSTLCLESIYILSATDPSITSYVWQNGTTSSSFLVSEAGTYVLTASNACGSDQDTITFDFEDCNCNVYVPNAFTPDGNEFNDVFTPSIDCQITDYQFNIYNRWGENVFETRDLNIGWDGSYGQKIAKEGIYTYVLSYYTEDKTNHVIHGHVNVIK